jgi:hypothetical protein
MWTFSAVLAITHSAGVCKGLVPLGTVARCRTCWLPAICFYTFVSTSVQIPYFRVSRKSVDMDVKLHNLIYQLVLDTFLTVCVQKCSKWHFMIIVYCIFLWISCIKEDTNIFVLFWKTLNASSYLDSWWMQPTYSCKILHIVQRE